MAGNRRTAQMRCDTQDQAGRVNTLNEEIRKSILLVSPGLRAPGWAEEGGEGGGCLQEPRLSACMLDEKPSPDTQPDCLGRRSCLLLSLNIAGIIVIMTTQL